MLKVFVLLCIVVSVIAQHGHHPDGGAHNPDGGVHHPDGGNHNHHHPEGCHDHSCASTVCPSGSVAQCHHGGVCTCDLPA